MSADELSFNLWVTPRMMLIVKREKEFAMAGDQRVDINSLGFVGTMAVKTEAGLEALKKESPIELLKQVAASS